MAEKPNFFFVLADQMRASALGCMNDEKVDTLISIVDFVPTLLGLAGVPVPDKMNGTDLSAVLLGDSDDVPSSVLITQPVSFGNSSAYQPWRGVRTERYTYSRWLQGGSLLFDNGDDPFQMRNLIHEPGHETLAKDLEEELGDWLDYVGDDFVSGEEHIRQLGLWEERLIIEEHF